MLIITIIIILIKDLDYLSKYKAKFDRIIPWIERDIKAILHVDDIDLIRDFIIGILKRYIFRHIYTHIHIYIYIFIIFFIKIIIYVYHFIFNFYEITRYDLDSEEAKDEISIFLRDKTNHFIHELKGFINSPFNIQTYDRETQYEKKSDHKVY